MELQLPCRVRSGTCLWHNTNLRLSTFRVCMCTYLSNVATNWSKGWIEGSNIWVKCTHAWQVKACSRWIVLDLCGAWPKVWVWEIWSQLWAWTLTLSSDVMFFSRRSRERRRDKTWIVSSSADSLTIARVGQCTAVCENSGECSGGLSLRRLMWPEGRDMLKLRGIVDRGLWGVIVRHWLWSEPLYMSYPWNVPVLLGEQNLELDCVCMSGRTAFAPAICECVELANHSANVSLLFVNCQWSV